MKVLENNYDSFRYTCISCESKLLIEPEDIQGGDVTQPYIQCPLCQKVQYLKFRDIPAATIRKLGL